LASHSWCTQFIELGLYQIMPFFEWKIHFTKLVLVLDVKGLWLILKGSNYKWGFWALDTTFHLPQEVFSHLPQKLKKITSKINILGTCPKFHLFVEHMSGTLGFNYLLPNYVIISLFDCILLPKISYRNWIFTTKCCICLVYTIFKFFLLVQSKLATKVMTNVQREINSHGWIVEEAWRFNVTLKHHTNRFYIYCMDKRVNIVFILELLCSFVLPITINLKFWNCNICKLRKFINFNFII